LHRTLHDLRLHRNQFTPDRRCEETGDRVEVLHREFLGPQRGNTSQLLHGVPALLAAAAKYFRLQPGDILMTGTPPGVGALERGDVVRCSIERLGTLRVEVR
jgi:2-keto-4-pentenoate hydratase/2-oxohepta-3-ene-1,7-dioic acid hydratase in catechol pathway